MLGYFRLKDRTSVARHLDADFIVKYSACDADAPDNATHLRGEILWSNQGAIVNPWCKIGATLSVSLVTWEVLCLTEL